MPERATGETALAVHILPAAAATGCLAPMAHATMVAWVLGARPRSGLNGRSPKSATIRQAGSP